MYTHIQVNMKKIIYGRLNIDIKIYIFGDIIYIYVYICRKINIHVIKRETSLALVKTFGNHSLRAVPLSGVS